MNIWHDIAADRISKEKFFACIEISKGGKNKYEMDKATGMLMLDRVLYTSTHYPANYGFIPRTYADDDDPLDVLVLCSEAILPMTLVQCYPIGVIKMIDSQSIDEKIIAIPERDPTYNMYSDVSQLPPHILDEIMHFFKVYKALEGKETIVEELNGKYEAVRVLEKCIKAYKDNFESSRKYLLNNRLKPKSFRRLLF